MVEIDQYEDQIPTTVIAEIAGLMLNCFGEAPAADFAERVAETRRPLALVVRIDGEAVGFKLGYEKNRDEFFGWLGGVSRAHRRKGIARSLLRRFDEWCRMRKYAAIVTESGNEYREMIILNLTEGFEIDGVRRNQEGQLRVLMRKRLS